MTVLSAQTVAAGVNIPARAPAPARAAVPATPVAIPRLLDRESAIRRAQRAMEGKTLSGVVSQVIGLAASPRGDMSQLADLISRDMMLASRVLHAANSAAYVSRRGPVATVADAVKHIGCGTVRNIAAAIGVFNAMPETAPDGFNAIRCWQHSFAVAQLCSGFASRLDDQNPANAYLVGLCHDLGEILLHTQFGAEYQQVLEIQQLTGRPRAELELEMLGLPHDELVSTILHAIALPPTVMKPIEAFHRTSIQNMPGADRLVRILHISDLFAIGSLMAASKEAQTMPLVQAECRSVLGQTDPAAPDGEALRNEILMMTGVLSKLSASEEEQLMAPLFARTSAKLMLLRESGLSGLDPVAAALSAMSDLTVCQTPPNPRELAGVAGLVVESRKASGKFGASQMDACLVAGIPVLWLTAQADAPAGRIAPHAWPVSLSKLAEFVQSAAEVKPGLRKAA